MTKHRLVVAEDHIIMRQGLCSMLESTGLYEIVGQAKNGLEAIQLAHKELPDLMILDISMPIRNGLSVIHDLKNKYQKLKFIVLSVHDTKEYLQESLYAGANGYCLKTGDFSELRTAIDTVLQGKTYISPFFTQPLLDNSMRSNRNAKPASTVKGELTQREIEILKLVGEGRKNKQIAKLLSISVKTVDKHRSNLMAKLDLHNSSALTTYAIRRGLVLQPTQQNPSWPD